MHMRKHEPVSKGVFVDPVPLSATVWGLAAASSDRVRVAVTAPDALGVKLTLIVHAAPGATVGMQLSVSANSAPSDAMLEMCSVAVP